MKQTPRDDGLLHSMLVIAFYGHTAISLIHLPVRKFHNEERISYLKQPVFALVL